MGGSPLNIFVWLAPAQCVVELQLSFVAIFVHVVVCLFVADMHNDAEPIWCWLMVVLHWEQEEGGGDWRRGGGTGGGGTGRSTVGAVQWCLRELIFLYSTPPPKPPGDSDEHFPKLQSIIDPTITT